MACETRRQLPTKALTTSGQGQMRAARHTARLSRFQQGCAVMAKNAALKANVPRAGNRDTR
jgi:hypothetical protein